jgi:hypothetical protein
MMVRGRTINNYADSYNVAVQCTIPTKDLQYSLATRKSHFNANYNPPVTATPLISPITSLVRGGKGPRSLDPPPPGRLCSVESSSFRSRPAIHAGTSMST